MNQTIDAITAQTQFNQIMDRVIDHNERVVVERNGEPAVVIISLSDFVRTVAHPRDWLQQSWQSAKEKGVDSLTMEEIDAEIAAARRERRERQKLPEE